MSEKLYTCVMADYHSYDIGKKIDVTELEDSWYDNYNTIIYDFRDFLSGIVDGSLEKFDEYFHTRTLFGNVDPVGTEYTYSNTNTEYVKDKFDGKGILPRGQALGCKVVAYIGGWGVTQIMSEIIRFEAGRNMAAGEVLEMVKAYGFDGILIDWRYIGQPLISDEFGDLYRSDDNPTSVDEANYISFLTEIKRLFDHESDHGHGEYYINTNLNADYKSCAYDLETIYNLVDTINLKTEYLADPLTGEIPLRYTDTIGQSIEGVVEDIILGGMDAAKFTIGMASRSGFNSSRRTNGVASTEVDTNSVWKRDFDDVDVSRFFDDSTINVGETFEKTHDKGKFIKEYRLGGVVDWVNVGDSILTSDEVLSEITSGIVDGELAYLAVGTDPDQHSTISPANIILKRGASHTFVIATPIEREVSSILLNTEPAVPGDSITIADLQEETIIHVNTVIREFEVDIETAEGTSIINIPVVQYGEDLDLEIDINYAYDLLDVTISPAEYSVVLADTNKIHVSNITSDITIATTSKRKIYPVTYTVDSRITINNPITEILFSDTYELDLTFQDGYELDIISVTNATVDGYAINGFTTDCHIVVSSKRIEYTLTVDSTNVTFTPPIDTGKIYYWDDIVKVLPVPDFGYDITTLSINGNSSVFDGLMKNVNVRQNVEISVGTVLIEYELDLDTNGNVIISKDKETYHWGDIPVLNYVVRDGYYITSRSPIETDTGTEFTLSQVTANSIFTINTTIFTYSVNVTTDMYSSGDHSDTVDWGTDLELPYTIAPGYEFDTFTASKPEITVVAGIITIPSIKEDVTVDIKSKAIFFDVAKSDDAHSTLSGPDTIQALQQLDMYVAIDDGYDLVDIVVTKGTGVLINGSHIQVLSVVDDVEISITSTIKTYNINNTSLSDKLNEVPDSISIVDWMSSSVYRANSNNSWYYANQVYLDDVLIYRVLGYLDATPDNVTVTEDGDNLVVTLVDIVSDMSLTYKSKRKKVLVTTTPPSEISNIDAEYTINMGSTLLVTPVFAEGYEVDTFTCPVPYTVSNGVYTISTIVTDIDIVFTTKVIQLPITITGIAPEKILWVGFVSTTPYFSDLSLSFITTVDVTFAQLTINGNVKAVVDGTFSLTDIRTPIVINMSTTPTIRTDLPPAHILGNTYVENDLVVYNGQIWRAKWWITSTPSASDQAWEFIEDVEPLFGFRPTIELVPGDTTVLQGTVYADNGAIANDIEDGDISTNIVISGSLGDAFAPGMYERVYTVTDSHGNPISITRPIEVLDNPDYKSPCEDKSIWDPAKPYYEYANKERYINDGKLWEVINTTYAVYEPSGINGHFGWKYKEDCIR